MLARSQGRKTPKSQSYSSKYSTTGIPAEGGPRAVSQDVEGEELPGRQGLHQRQPGHHRHQGREEPRLQGGQIRELFLFLD